MIAIPRGIFQNIPLFLVRPASRRYIIDAIVFSMKSKSPEKSKGAIVFSLFEVA